MTPIRHLTLEEYKTTIFPLIQEARDFLKKKFVFNPIHGVYGIGFHFVTADEYAELEKNNTTERFLELFNVNTPSELTPEQLEHLESALERDAKSVDEKLKAHKLKPTAKMPTDLHERFTEICETLKPLLSYERIMDWSKTNKDHKSEVRYNLERDVYTQELLDGDISIEELEEICASVNVRIPKRVYDMTLTSSETKAATRFVKKNPEFFNNMVESLDPFMSKLEEELVANLWKLFEDYNNSKFARPLDYCTARNQKESLRQLVTLLHSGWEIGSEELKKDYRNQLTQKFMFRLHDKIGVINENHGNPTLTHQHLSANNGVIEAHFTVSYDDGLNLSGKTQLIVAGGYIQSAHYRYLTHLSLDGKMVTQEELDSL